jgi:DNA-binding CsgD family transcriptional regulator
LQLGSEAVLGHTRGVDGRALHAFARISRVASDPQPRAERARAVLEELRAIVPYEHAEIAYDDPFSGKRRLLVNAGYADDLLEHFHGDEFAASLAELRMYETGQPHCMRDVPGDKLAVRTIAEFLLPAGYREGLTMALRTEDGRVTGLLNLSTGDRAHPTDEARDAVAALCSTLANVADATRSARFLLQLVEPGAAAVALGHDGTAVALPGVAGHRLLAEHSRLLRVARRLALRDRRATRFLWPAPDRRWHRVAVTPCLDDDGCAALVSLAPGPIGIDLTRRELEVLTMVTAGWSNGEIGARLSISPRTVGTYVEQILVKLAVPTRAAAAARAVAEGLIVPLEALGPLRSVG